MENVDVEDRKDHCVDIEGYLLSNGILPESVDNYEWLSPKDGAEQIRLMGLYDHVTEPSCLIMYKDLDRNPILDGGVPYRRIRLSDVDAGNGKYKAPMGSSVHLYIPKSFERVYRGRGSTVFITEGEKKADVACANNIPCVALGGIYSWAQSDKTSLMPELSHLLDTLEVSTAVVVFDSDGDPIHGDSMSVVDRRLIGLKKLNGVKGMFVKNVDVYRAAKRLAHSIAAEKRIKVSFGFCKHIIEDVEHQVLRKTSSKTVKSWVKNGLDDWLALDKAAVLGLLASLESRAELPSFAREISCEPLGYVESNGGQDQILIVYRPDIDSVTRSPSTKLNSIQALRTLIGQEDSEKYRVFSEDGVDKYNISAAHKEIYSQCVSKGVWNAQVLERGGGLWRSLGGDLVLNTSSGLFMLTGHQFHRVDRLIKDTREFFMTPRTGYMDGLSSLVTMPYPSMREVADSILFMIGNISTFEYKSQDDSAAVYILLGWVAAQIYSGVAEIRPHIYIDGEKGSGKSLLLEFMASALRGYAAYVQNSTDSTNAGVASMLKGNATSVILDEMELKESDRRHGAESKLESFMGLIKAAYSLNSFGFNQVKGTSEGGFRDAGATAGFMFASISKGEIDAAAESRIITLTVQNRTVKTAAVNLEDAGRYGMILMRYMLSESVHEDFESSALYLKTRMREINSEISEREANTMAYTCAAFLPLYKVVADEYNSGQGPSYDEIRRIMPLYLVEKVLIKMKEGTDRRPDGLKEISKILDVPVDYEEVEEGEYGRKIIKMTYTVRDLVLMSTSGADQFAVKSLKNIGIYVYREGGEFFVGIKNVIKNKVKGVNMGYIKTLKDCHHGFQKQIDGERHRLLSVPLDTFINAEG